MRLKKLSAGLILMLVCCLIFTSCDFPTICLGGIPDPGRTVTDFFGSLCERDFVEADNYLANFSINMEDEISGEFAESLLDYLCESYDYELTQKINVDGLEATQKVRFRYLDLNLLTDDLRTKSTEIGKRYIYKLNEKYTTVVDSVCTLTDEGAELVAVEALDIIMEEPEKYYAEKDFDVILKYSNKKWLIQLNDELFNAITGKYIVSE